MNKFFLFFIAVLSFSADIYGQYYTNQNKMWVFGDSAGVNFTTGSPVPFHAEGFSTDEGSASVSNAAGTLLFYTDGKNVWNGSGSLMPHGSSIVSFTTSSTTQAALIVPVIGNANRYYVFSLEQMGSWGVGINHFAYSIVDMTLDGGNGDLVTDSIGIVLGSSKAEKLIAIPGNNCNIWLVTHSKDSAIFYTYSITAAGISTPVVSAVGSFGGNDSYGYGSLKVSPNRLKIVAQCYYRGHGTELYDFNPGTGIVSNCQVLENSTDCEYGAEFSPDNTKLYCGQICGSIAQYDISLSTTTAIVGSKTIVATESLLGDLKLAPDNKIYFGQCYTGFLDCIPYPNVAGTSCGFITNAVTLSTGSIYRLGLPNVVYTRPDDTTYTHHDTLACMPTGGSVLIAGHDTLIGSSYIWNDGTTTTWTKSVTTAGTYWVRMYNGCGLKIDTIHVLLNNRPTFINGVTQTIAICEDALPTAVNSLLKAIDIDSGQVETWHVVSAPSHGILIASSVVTSTGDTLIPSGLTYTPDSGFTGNDSFKIEIFDGCDGDTTTIHVTVNPLPDAGIITSDGVNAFCIGYHFLIHETATGGIWNLSNGHVTLSGDTITAISPGEDTIYYTVTNSCGTDIAIDTFSVAPPLPLLMGNLAVCVGDTTVLRDSVWGGIWLGGNAHVFVGDNILDSGLVAGISAGTAIITYQMDLGCYTTAVVTVNPLPVAEGSVSPIKCFGANDGSITLTVNGPFLFLWSNGALSSSIDSLSPGVYTVKINDILSPCTLSDTFHIVQPDSIFISAEIKKNYCNSANGAIITTTSGGNSPYNFLWSNNVTTSSLYELASGAYVLTVTDLNGCAKSVSFAVQDSACSEVIIHNGMSPNGDGINDTWIIEGIQDYPKNTVQVFDKYGDMIFERSNYKNDWSGAGKNGLLPDGTYYYVVKLNQDHVSGVKDAFTGSLLIKR